MVSHEDLAMAQSDRNASFTHAGRRRARFNGLFAALT